MAFEAVVAHPFRSLGKFVITPHQEDSARIQALQSHQKENDFKLMGPAIDEVPVENISRCFDVAPLVARETKTCKEEKQVAQLTVHVTENFDRRSYLDDHVLTSHYL